MNRIIFYAGIIALLISTQAMAFSGIFQLVQGNVQVKSGADGTLSLAKVGTKVFPQDIVITASDGRAKLVMQDRNILNIGSGSSIQIQKYDYESDQKKKNVRLNVIYGSVRARLEQKYDSKNSKFQIKTLTAVSGVRGTDFLVSFENNVTKVYTFEGAVEFGLPGPNDTIVNPVVVSKNMTSENIMGVKPKSPASFNEEQKQEAKEITKVESETKEEITQTKQENLSKETAKNEKTINTAEATVSNTPQSSSDHTKAENIEPVSDFNTDLSLAHNFEIGIARMFQSDLAYTDSPFLGFSPKFTHAKFPNWFYLSPRADIQFNKSGAGNISPVYNVGLQGGFIIDEKTDVAIEASISYTSEGSVSKAFASMGLWAGRKINPVSFSFLHNIDRMFIGYRRLDTPNHSHLIAIGVDFGFTKNK